MLTVNQFRMHYVLLTIIVELLASNIVVSRTIPAVSSELGDMEILLISELNTAILKIII